MQTAKVLLAQPMSYNKTGGLKELWPQSAIIKDPLNSLFHHWPLKTLKDVYKNLTVNNALQW